MNYPVFPFAPLKPDPKLGLSPIEDIIEDIRQGKMVVLVDDEDRENEGDIVIAAEYVTAEHINFMARHARGLICLTLSEQRCQQLDLPLMVRHNRAQLGTNFTVSIEAAEGVTTGISAADRARTVQAAIAADAKPEDIVRPGHIFPLMAQKGGVLARAGHTEAGCDVTALAGLEPASVICEIMREYGEMARLTDLIEFAKEHDLKVGTIADLIRYRNQHETLVEQVAEREIQTAYGKFNLKAYRDWTTQKTHLALIYGEPEKLDSALVRVHEPLSVIDLLEQDHNAHSWSVNEAMQAIQQAGAGMLIFLRREQSEQDLITQISNPEAIKNSAYELKDYGIGAQIIKDQGVRRMRLMTHPRKIPNMNGFGLEVEEYLLPDLSGSKGPKNYRPIASDWLAPMNDGAELELGIHPK